MTRLLTVNRSLVLACIVAIAIACSTKRDDPAPTFRTGIGALLGAKCAACHEGTTPAAGFRVATYLDAIGCVTSDGAPATRAIDAPILRVLARPSHAGFLSGDERALLERWISAGAPAFPSGVHSSAFADPRSPDSHAQYLRARRWKPMLDANDPDACAACHEGTPTAPDRPRSPAPGATSCTSCHAEPGGPLACSTCHGAAPPARAYPPRDVCFHPDARPAGAHAAHVESSEAKRDGIVCTSCHPTPAFGVLEGVHGDGLVQVALAGGAEHFDATSGLCATACHAGPGAARPTPAWTETTKMGCNDCHGAPPTPHLAGACSNCHREANATGTGLLSTSLHIDGKVELGDGSATCGACHGTAADPSPTTGAHAAHSSPTGAAKVACATCHAVPSAGSAHPLGKPATVRLLGLAAKGGLAPTYDATTGTCANVYCHALRGAAVPSPVWTGVAGGSCGSCHGIPPTPPHTTATTCGTGSCHGGSVESGVLTTAGAAHHVDGTIDLALP